jgi:hypothetical protein
MFKKELTRPISKDYKLRVAGALAKRAYKGFLARGYSEQSALDASNPVDIYNWQEVQGWRAFDDMPYWEAITYYVDRWITEIELKGGNLLEGGV